MSCICLIDSSVLLNLLRVPGRSQHSQQMTADFRDYIEAGATLLLPMATIVETGNHIAQCGDGGTRRRKAEDFCNMVRQSFEDNPPWRTCGPLAPLDMLKWLDAFPEAAMRNKSPAKTSEGTSFGDLSIIQEYERCCRQFPMSEVFIWSLDADLRACFHRPV